MVRRGDLIRYVAPSGLKRVALLVSTPGSPDTHWLLFHSDLTTSRRYSDSCAHCGLTLRGEQHLNRGDAALRMELERLSLTREGAAAIRDGRGHAEAVTRRGTTRRVEREMDPSEGVGTLPEYQPPLVLAEGMTSSPTVQMQRFVENRHGERLDEMRERNLAGYRMYIDSKIEKRPHEQKEAIDQLVALSRRVAGS